VAVVDELPDPLLMLDLTRAAGDVAVLEPPGGPVDDRKATSPAGCGTRSRATRDHRLDSLSGEARCLMEVAAMLGSSFLVNDAAHILGRAVGNILPAVEEALRAGVLVPGSDMLAFRDEGLRRSIYEGLPEPLRLGLHGQIGRLRPARIT